MSGHRAAEHALGSWLTSGSAGCMMGGSNPQNEPLMRHRAECPAAPFTAAERELLRRELCRHFGQDPRVADGIFLRTWRGGERRNQPKIPPAVQSMVERRLVEVRTTSRGPRAFFTGIGSPQLRLASARIAPWRHSGGAANGRERLEPRAIPEASWSGSSLEQLSEQTLALRQPLIRQHDLRCRGSSHRRRRSGFCRRTA